MLKRKCRSCTRVNVYFPDNPGCAVIRESQCGTVCRKVVDRLYENFGFSFCFAVTPEVSLLNDVLNELEGVVHE